MKASSGKEVLTPNRKLIRWWSIPSFLAHFTTGSLTFDSGVDILLSLYQLAVFQPLFRILFGAVPHLTGVAQELAGLLVSELQLLIRSDTCRLCYG